MRLARRLLPATLALVALSIPVVALAQDMMGVLSTQDTSLGTIVTDASGRTVYQWAGDTPGSGMSNCTDACSGPWPPVPADMQMMSNMMPGMSMTDMSMNMSGVGVIQRADGSYQLTWNGSPLYYFARDAAPGDTNGNGSNGFGAAWSVIMAGM